MNITPNSDWILVNKAQNDHVRNDSGDVVLYHTERTQEYGYWCEIVEEGPKCKHIIPEMRGMFVVGPELSNDMKEFPTDDGNKFMFIRERFLMNDNRGFVIKV